MVLYEVNLIIDKAIAKEFTHWLKPHVESILKLTGFIEAKYLEQINPTEGKPQLTVQYSLENTQALENHLNNHSQKMREDGLNRFPNQFTATRRIFNII